MVKLLILNTLIPLLSYAHENTGNEHFFHPGWTAFGIIVLIGISGIALQMHRDRKK